MQINTFVDTKPDNELAKALVFQITIFDVPYCPAFLPTSLENIIKRPRIRKTALPSLIHRLCRLPLIPTDRSRQQRQLRSPPHTRLMLTDEFPIRVGEVFTAEAALPAEGRGSDFRAGGVFEVIVPVDVEAEVVVGVDHFWKWPVPSRS